MQRGRRHGRWRQRRLRHEPLRGRARARAELGDGLGGAAEGDQRQRRSHQGEHRGLCRVLLLTTFSYERSARHKFINLLIDVCEDSDVLPHPLGLSRLALGCNFQLWLSSPLRLQRIFAPRQLLLQIMGLRVRCLGLGRQLHLAGRRLRARGLQIAAELPHLSVSLLAREQRLLCNRLPLGECGDGILRVRGDSVGLGLPGPGGRQHL
mmetsp:Transcript_37867/g.96018  ORF Transcript_37867/g.96018 Transcript_37867/m.96018 type:complete len:208 (+) Transcript_37867:105-728(+)